MDHPGRAWLADLTGEHGKLVDIFRRLHPKEQAWTCVSSFTLPASAQIS
jgi:exonuclease III